MNIPLISLHFDLSYSNFLIQPKTVEVRLFELRLNSFLFWIY